MQCYRFYTTRVDKDTKEIIEVPLGVYRSIESAKTELSKRYNWADVKYKVINK